MPMPVKIKQKQGLGFRLSARELAEACKQNKTGFRVQGLGFRLSARVHADACKQNRNHYFHNLTDKLCVYRLIEDMIISMI
jgi:hypothetical protein